MIGAAGISWWFCNGVTGKFRGPEPDRSDCKSPWIKQIGDMLNQNNTTAGQIVDTLVDSLGKSQCDLFGGDLLEISSYLDPLYLKQEQQVRTQDGGNFTVQMYSITDSLIKCDHVWGEVPSDAIRYDVSSQILQSIDKVGFLFLRQNIGTFNFTFYSLAVTLKNGTTNKNSWSCFEFPSGSYGSPVVRFRHKWGVKDGVPLGKICIPNVAYNNTRQGLSVASALQFNNRERLIFPSFSNDPQTNLSTIIGLSIDNKTHVDLPSGSPPVQITFYQVCHQIFDILLYFVSYRNIFHPVVHVDFGTWSYMNGPKRVAS